MSPTPDYKFASVSAIPTDSSNAQPPAGAQSPLDLAVVITEVAARREEFERLLHIPRDMIATMKRAGIFRAGTPKQFGGDALPPATFLRMLERIAIADGSAAWVAAFGSANTYLAALPIETQREIYRTGPDQVFAGGLYPVQPAMPTPDGWSVTGRWRFASGCMGADWIGVGIGGTPPGAGGPDAGKPLTAVFPAAEVEIVQNWNVVGLQATGSHDLRLNGKHVTSAWTFARGARAVIDEPLYRYPSVAYQAEVHASVNVGLARAALDVVTSKAGGTKTTTGAPRLADRGYYRTELAKAEAQWRSVRAFFYESSERAWDTLLRGDPVPSDEANLLRLSATHAAQTCADVVQTVFRLAGTAAIYLDNPLQRLVRDSMVVTQHAFLSEGIYDAAGAMFAGVPPVPPYP
jgi:alkylation response protein AidB-like acyl-CoA dehydrogenase